MKYLERLHNNQNIGQKSVEYCSKILGHFTVISKILRRLDTLGRFPPYPARETTPSKKGVYSKRNKFAPGVGWGRGCGWG